MIDRTRKDIVNAFNHLISKKEFDKITALLIAQEAGVSKATFYRYFKDKYEVMNYNYKELLDRLAHSQECHNYQDLFYSLFFTGQKEWKYLRYAFESTGVNSFKNYIYTYSKEFVLKITKENRENMGFSAEEELQIEVFCSGISHMYSKWIMDGYHMSPYNAAKALYEIMPESLRDYPLT